MFNFANHSFDRQKILKWLPVIGSVSFLVFSLFSVLFMFNQAQDARRQADVAQKVAEVTINPSEAVFRPNTTASFDVLVDTKGTATDGVQVVFDVTGVSASNLTLSVPTNTGLKKVWEKVEPINNGKRVSLAFIPSEVTTTFSTSSPRRIATVFLNPTAEGTVSVTFDQSWTKTNQTKTTLDVLKDTPQKTFRIAAAPTPTPVPTSTPTPIPTAPVSSPTPTPSPTPGTGGGSVSVKTSSLSNDHLQCQYSEFEAVYDLKENNAPVGNVQVRFTFQGQTRVTTTNTGGRAKATFSRSQSGTVRAEATGFPTQEMSIKAPNCPTPTPVPTPRPTTRPSTSTGTTYRPTATPYPTLRPTTSPRPSATPKSISATVTIDSKASPSPSASPGKGGTTGVGSGGLACNVKCQSTTQCGKDLMCYQGTCRLIDNTESVTCQPKDQTGSKVCDQNCNLNADCGDGLSCLQGKCRLSANPYSTTCAQPTAQDKSTVSGNCNQSCQTNSDCGVLLDCYKGQCRLPSNPKQAQCLTKEEAERSGFTDQEDATDSAVVTASVSPSPQATASPLPETQPSLLSRVLRWMLILGGLVVLAVGGLLGYAWYQDRKVRVG